jgi:hypothetical protein
MTDREKELFYNLNQAIVKLEYKRDFLLRSCNYNRDNYYWNKAHQINLAIIKIKRFTDLMYSQLVLGGNKNVF